MVEDSLAQYSQPQNDPKLVSFGEKTRELGAFLAHEALEEITELVRVVPQACEEIKKIGSCILPDKLQAQESPFSSPAKNYEYIATQAHLAIDSAFSSDQAELYMPEFRSNNPTNNFAIGMLPFPVGVPKLFSNTSKLIEAGNVLDRAGFTKAGRALMKHGYREVSVFPKPLGNPRQINEFGQQMLETILQHPERNIVQKYTKHSGKVIDIRAPKIGGVRYNALGKFIGFLEPN